MKFHIQPAQSSDLDEILEMSARHYGPNYYSSRCRWADVFTFEPSSRPENFFIARDDTGRSLGAIRLVERTVILRGVEVRVLVLAHFMSEPFAAGKGVARCLLEHAEAQARARGFDLLLCWGRRKIDGMLRRFGLWGVSNYQATTVTRPPAATVHLQAVDPGDAERLAENLLALYDGTYSGMPFFYRRTVADFRYLARVRAVHTGMRILVLGRADALNGYVVMDSEQVHEAAGDPQVLFAAFGTLTAAGKPAVTTLGLAHPFLRMLLGQDHTWAQRRTWEGGHVAKILDPCGFLNRLVPAMARDLAHLRAGAATFHIGHCRGEWNGARLRFVPTTDAAGPETVMVSERTWAPLLLGTFDTTAHVPDLARSEAAELAARLLFPACHPYFGPSEEV